MGSVEREYVPGFSVRVLRLISEAVSLLFPFDGPGRWKAAGHEKQKLMDDGQSTSTSTPNDLHQIARIEVAPRNICLPATLTELKSRGIGLEAAALS